MGLFNKNKEPREIKDDDSLIVKLWYNPRTHAAIVLGLYFVFFLIIILVVNFTGKKPTSSAGVKGSNTKELFESLKDKDINYNYAIKEGSKTYYFSGTNNDDGIYGTILNNGDSSNILIKDDECRVGTYSDNGEFVLAFSLCPENINYKYFDYDNIYNLIKDKKGVKNDADLYYQFELDDKSTLRIYYDESNILSKITINNGNKSYELSFDVQEEQSNALDE